MFILVARGDGGVHSCRNDQRGAGNSHEGGHGGCDGSVEGLLAAAEAASNEAASENLDEISVYTRDLQMSSTYK